MTPDCCATVGSFLFPYDGERFAAHAMRVRRTASGSCPNEYAYALQPKGDGPIARKRG